MKIIEEDLVDWEPLFIRFHFPTPLASDRHVALCDFLEGWFQTNADARRSDCDIRFWNVNTDELSAACEHLTRSALRRLTKAIGRRFPEIDAVRIGVAFDGVPSGLDFKWIPLTDTVVQMGDASHDVEPFAVSKFQVSMGQFSEFMADSGYVPDCDKAEYNGYLESHMKLNWGKSPKTPVFGVTFNDANAFAEWAQLRLPTEIEIHAFFVKQAVAGVTPEWSGDCWTTTQTESANYILRNGPYPRTLELPIEKFRETLPADHYDYPFPVFRVAKSLEKKPDNKAVNRSTHSRGN
jgi:hypothetical protein